MFKKQIKYVCPACDNDEVYQLAYVGWCKDKQTWVYQEGYSDSITCSECGEDVNEDDDWSYLDLKDHAQLAIQRREARNARLKDFTTL